MTRNNPQKPKFSSGNAIVVALIALAGVVISALIGRGYFDPPPKPKPEIQQPQLSPTEPAKTPVKGRPTSQLDGALYFRNTCATELRLMIRYKQADGEYINAGWWTFPGGQHRYLSHEGKTLRSVGGPIYFFANSPNGEFVSPNEEGLLTVFKGKKLVLTEAALQLDKDGDYVLEVNCPDE